MITIDSSLIGKMVVADGGASIEGTTIASREQYKGMLSGRIFTYNGQGWRWLELSVSDSERCRNVSGNGIVWVEESYVYMSHNACE